ncbi:MRPS5 [Candida pseudojiufengensis]|uniref:MRPS5 n=1 Tax=Candida pseudojiufengensis TaxID=497109 RepID=UPI0022248DB2|nr:MRPS5 [Candida pseudojiufengensis]KAI5963586.1 MRPS5 [Candida pseudojiufengensis]
MFRSTLRPIQAFQKFLHTSSPVFKESTIVHHLDFLKKYYTPEILESIKIAESVVEPKDYLNLQLQGRDGLSKIAPTNKNFDYSRNDPEWEEPILYPNQGLGRTPYPAIPQVHSADRGDLKIRFSNAPRAPNDTAQSNTAIKTPFQIARELSQLTGLDERCIRNLYIRPLVMKRVSLKTAKGNIANFFVMSVAGDKNGMIGLGIGKSRDGIRTAATKAHWNAIKNLTPIKRYDNRTILGSIELKYHATTLKFKSAPVGFGLRCNRNIFEICQAAGIKDLRGKVHKSRNPVLVAQGFVKALTQQKTIEELALNRGKNVVELRKAYYSND